MKLIAPSGIKEVSKKPDLQSIDYIKRLNLI